MTVTQSEADKAVDEGRVEIAMRSGKFWKVRRNGKTFVPKKAPDGWHIPVKYGLSGYARIDAAMFANGYVRIVT